MNSSYNFAADSMQLANLRSNIRSKLAGKLNLDLSMTHDFYDYNENTKKRHIYHHIGIYAFTKEALLRYVSLNRTKNELDRNLEQLRALENNMKIHVGYTSTTPLSIDTEEDLKNVRELMKL